MSHPEFLRGLKGAVARKTRGIGGCAPQSFFTSHAKPQAARERRKRDFGDTPNPAKGLPPSGLSLGEQATRARNARKKFGMTHNHKYLLCVIRDSIARGSSFRQGFTRDSFLELIPV